MTELFDKLLIGTINLILRIAAEIVRGWIMLCFRVPIVFIPLTLVGTAVVLLMFDPGLASNLRTPFTQSVSGADVKLGLTPHLSRTQLWPLPYWPIGERLSPDGKKLALIGDNRVSIFDPLSGSLEADFRVDQSAPAALDFWSLVWSSDSSKVAFSEDATDYRTRSYSDIWVIDINGKTLKDVTNDHAPAGVSFDHSRGVLDWKPTWIDNATLGYFCGSPNSGTGVCQSDLNGKKSVLFNVSPQLGDMANLTWIPNRAAFAFTTSKDAALRSGSFFLAGRQGENRATLGQGGWRGWVFEASPSGDAILTEHYPTDNPQDPPQLDEVSLTSRQVTMLTEVQTPGHLVHRYEWQDQGAVWSSDGSHIAYLARDGADSPGLWVVGANGLGRTKIESVSKTVVFFSLAGWAGNVLAVQLAASQAPAQVLICYF